MENDYPKAMYRPGSEYEIWGGSFDFRVVADADEEESAAQEGWTTTPAPPEATPEPALRGRPPKEL